MKEGNDGSGLPPSADAARPLSGELYWFTREQLQAFTQKPKRMQEIMRKHGFVIDNLEDRWQKFAFTLYSEIVEMGDLSKEILDCMDEEASLASPEKPEQTSPGNLDVTGEERKIE